MNKNIYKYNETHTDDTHTHTHTHTHTQKHMCRALVMLKADILHFKQAALNGQVDVNKRLY